MKIICPIRLILGASGFMLSSSDKLIGLSAELSEVLYKLAAYGQSFRLTPYNSRSTGMCWTQIQAEKPEDFGPLSEYANGFWNIVRTDGEPVHFVYFEDNKPTERRRHLA